MHEHELLHSVAEYIQHRISERVPTNRHTTDTSCHGVNVVMMLKRSRPVIILLLLPTAHCHVKNQV